MGNEIWKPINFLYYENYNTGKVRNKDTGKFKKAIISADGFSTVALYNNGKHKRINIHTLVGNSLLKTQVIMLDI